MKLKLKKEEWEVVVRAVGYTWANNTDLSTEEELFLHDVYYSLRDQFDEKVDRKPCSCYNVSFN